MARSSEKNIQDIVDRIGSNLIKLDDAKRMLIEVSVTELMIEETSDELMKAARMIGGIMAFYEVKLAQFKMILEGGAGHYRPTGDRPK